MRAHLIKSLYSNSRSSYKNSEFGHQLWIKSTQQLSVVSSFQKGQRRGLMVGSTSNQDASASSSKSISPASDRKENLSASDSTEVKEAELTVRSTISKAMQSYLERAREHQKFIKDQEEEFVFGRRHLANMMGKNPENFTQKDIDEAIRYLFPAGLFEPKARPLMKPPEEIYPRQKAAQFDINGRPYHPFFYTTKPNFYFLIHEFVGKIQGLNSSSQAAQLKPVDRNSDLGGTVWLGKEDLEKVLVEYITDELYNEFVNVGERLVNHPRGGKELEFIKKYRKSLKIQSKTSELPKVTLEPDGKQSVTMTNCRRKSAVATVTVRMPGTGIFNINGKGLEYFDTIKPRQMLLYPLQLVNWVGTVDVTSNVTSYETDLEAALRPSGNRLIGEAYIIRWAMANCLAALGADYERLRLAGLLTVDIRKKERSHIAHCGARAAWTWKKR